MDGAAAAGVAAPNNPPPAGAAAGVAPNENPPAAGAAAADAPSQEHLNDPKQRSPRQTFAIFRHIANLLQYVAETGVKKGWQTQLSINHDQ